MEASPMMTAAISQTGKMVESIAAKQKTADEYPEKEEIQTRVVSLGTRTPHYRNVWTSSVVVVTFIWTMTSHVRKAAGAEFRPRVH